MNNTIDVENMDRDLALMIYKGRIYEDVNHQYALEIALAEEGVALKDLGLDIEENIDKVADLTKTLDEEGEIFNFSIYQSRNGTKYLVAHSRNYLSKYKELINAYASQFNLTVGIFKSFTSSKVELI
mgnify:CR=1 FL=1